MNESTVQLKEAKTLPQGWRWVRLGEVCDGDSGIWGDIPDGSKECYPILRSNNIQGGTMGLSDVAIRKVIEPSIVEAKSLQMGDILVTTSSGSKDLLGKSALFFQPSDGQKYLFSNFTMRLRPRAQISEPFFLYFYLQSSEAKQVLRLLQDTTTGLRNLDRKEFLAQAVPLPPIPEQKRIAAKLQKLIAEVERARTACEAQLEAARALPQAYLRQVFESEEAKKWERRKLGEIIEDIQPGFACGKRAGDDGVIQLRMNNISTRGQIDLSSVLRVPATEEQVRQYCLLPGDIVFNNTNSVELVGKTALFHEAKGVFVYSNHLTRLRTRAGVLDPVYLTFWLQLQWYQRLFERICNRWIGQAAVKREKLLALEMPLPALPEQKHIATELQGKIADAEKLKLAIEKELETIKALPQAILRKAFRGEL